MKDAREVLHEEVAIFCREQGLTLREKMPEPRLSFRKEHSSSYYVQNPVYDTLRNIDVANDQGMSFASIVTCYERETIKNLNGLIKFETYNLVSIRKYQWEEYVYKVLGLLSCLKLPVTKIVLPESCAFWSVLFIGAEVELSPRIEKNSELEQIGNAIFQSGVARQGLTTHIGYTIELISHGVMVGKIHNIFNSIFYFMGITESALIVNGKGSAQDAVAHLKEVAEDISKKVSYKKVFLSELYNGVDEHTKLLRTVYLKLIELNVDWANEDYTLFKNRYLRTKAFYSEKKTSYRQNNEWWYKRMGIATELYEN